MCKYSDFDDIHIVRLTMWHHLFLVFWLVDTWFFADWRHQRAATRLKNVRQPNIRTGKKLGFQLPYRHPSTNVFYFIAHIAILASGQRSLKYLYNDEMDFCVNV